MAEQTAPGQAAPSLAAAAGAQDQRAASDPLKGAAADRRMEAFKKSPDPWAETAAMEFGGDRTFASGIQTLIFDADPSQYPALEKKLLGLLAGTDAARDFACRMLALIGSAQSVPALARLLEDPKTSDIARYALENIPGPEVDAALQAALPKLSGAARQGLEGTIAARAAFAAMSGGGA